MSAQGLAAAALHGYNSLVKIATISQTKNGLSALLDLVRHGETILITDRNRPIARIVPVSGETDDDGDGRLSRLERAGIIRRRAPGASAREIARTDPPEAERGGDILEVLLEERRSSR